MTSIRQARAGGVDAICTFDHVARVEAPRRRFLARSVEDGAAYVAVRDGQVGEYLVLEHAFFSSQLQPRPGGT